MAVSLIVNIHLDIGGIAWEAGDKNGVMGMAGSGVVGMVGGGNHTLPR